MHTSEVFAYVIEEKAFICQLLTAVLKVNKECAKAELHLNIKKTMISTTEEIT